MVFTDLERGAVAVVKSMGKETSKTVGHKYGEDAGKVTDDSLAAASHGINLAYVRDYTYLYMYMYNVAMYMYDSYGDERVVLTVNWYKPQRYNVAMHDSYGDVILTVLGLLVIGKGRQKLLRCIPIVNSVHRIKVLGLTTAVLYCMTV